MIIIPYEDKYRDDLIFMVLQAKDALGRKPTINEDLLSIKDSYFNRGYMFWVAIDENDRVIGCIGYSKTDKENEAFIHRLYVKASEKHKGIGTALLEIAEKEMKSKGINISFISNNYMNYYPITIDSNTDSSIAYVYESSGISLVFFNKAGTYDLTYNVETGVLTIIDQNPEEPGDSSVEYMYFLSVVNSSSGNQTLYFTRTPDENKEVVIKDATLDANCYIAVGGVAVDGSGSTENYGALSGTDSSIAVSYGTLILVKQSGTYDVYFNTETKTARLVLVGEIEVAPSVPKDIYIRYDNILTLGIIKDVVLPAPVQPIPKQ